MTKTQQSTTAAGKEKQGDRRHDDGDGRHDDSKGRHSDGKRQQGDRRYDDGDCPRLFQSMARFDRVMGDAAYDRRHRNLVRG